MNLARVYSRADPRPPRTSQLTVSESPHGLRHEHHARHLQAHRDFSDTVLVGVLRPLAERHVLRMFEVRLGVVFGVGNSV